MKSKVAVIRCKEYNARQISSAIERGFSLLGGIESFFKKDEKILLKPNMLSAKKPDSGVITHPEFVRAAIKTFQKISQNIFVGDSPGGAVDGVERVWQETGLDGVCQEEGVKKLYFEKSGTSIVRSKNRRIKNIELSKAVLDMDAVVSLPKMKTHTLMLFTGAIKNLFGCVPGLRKVHYHFYAVHPDDFGELLAEILSILLPRFAIVDAISSMEGEGPSAGTLRDTGVIIMGADLVAVDAVTAVIMGFNPRRDPTLLAAEKLNLGRTQLEDIEVVGDGSLKDFVIPDFKRPSNWKVKLVPRFLGPLFKKIFWTKPKIDLKVCKRCQLCLKSCPVKAILKDGEDIVVNKKLCIECMCCHELCPERAVSIEYSLLADILTKNSSSRRYEKN